MCKKYIKVFVLSCIFVLLLGLSCQSLASISTDMSYTEFKNIVYNYCSSFGTDHVNETLSMIETNDENLYSIYSHAGESYIIGQRSSAGSSYGIRILVYGFESQAYASSNTLYLKNTSGSTISYYQISYNSFSSNSVSNNSTFSCYLNGYITLTNNVYNSSTGTTVVKLAGMYPSNSDEGAFLSYVWEFNPAPNDYLYLSLDNQNKFYKLSKTMNYLDLGTLADSVYTGSVITQYYFYNKARNDWDFYLSLDDFSAWASQNITDVYTTNVIDDIMYSYITAKSKNVTENVIINLVIAPYDNQPVDEGLNCWFYVVGSHTVVNSGDNTVNVTDTFNDDYYNDYIDGLTDIVDNPTNSLINAITDLNNSIIDNSLIGSIFDEYFSGDSGDIANRLGYHVFDNPFLNLFDTIAVGVRNVLLGSGNQTLSFNLHGHTWTFNSDSFIIPNTGIRIFVALVVNFFIVFFVCGFFFNMIMHIAIGELSPVLRFFKSHAMSITKFM